MSNNNKLVRLDVDKLAGIDLDDYAPYRMK